MYDDHSHTKDSDCNINPDTYTCDGCGVYHGDPCPLCGGRGFHTETCEHQRNDPEYDDASEVGENERLREALDRAVQIRRNDNPKSTWTAKDVRVSWEAWDEQARTALAGKDGGE